MKTLLTIAFTLTVVVCIHAEEQIPASFEGTYLSEEYIQSLKETKCHIAALRVTLEKDIFEVIMIKDNTVYSNLKFHDQYALKSDEFSHNWQSSNSNIITDKKNHAYRKVSTNTNYSVVIQQFYFNLLLNERLLSDGKGNYLSKSEKGLLLLNTDEFRLYLDIIERNDEMDIVYNRLLKKTYGICAEDNKINIYDVRSVGEISFDIDEDTIRLIYSFQQ